jgi:hypothetical protein
LPKADADPDELYACDIEERKEALGEVVAGSRWIVDFITLFALYAGVSTIFTVMFRRLTETGFNIKLASGTVVAFACAWLLFWPAIKAVEIAAEGFLLHLRRHFIFFLPYGFEHHNIVFRAFWRASVTTIKITAVWGTGLLGSELVKSTGVLQ